MSDFSEGEVVNYIQEGEKYPATVRSITPNGLATTVEIEFVAADPLGTGQQTLKLNKTKGRLEKAVPLGGRRRSRRSRRKTRKTRKTRRRT